MDPIQIKNGAHYNFTLKLEGRVTVEFKALDGGTLTLPDWMVLDNGIWLLAGEIQVEQVGDKLILQEVVKVVGCSPAMGEDLNR
ncbi:hypothetical protein CEP52_017376 [Fusarium oligoseptatum]|uniref:Uncharacterized protein n=2 Tax=Fusarium solani species complex TaxID=232080 RepID=A0A428RSX5_9HYPO|nr:hypothetical protein CEP52_017376 [Fusarium oligoseptatum]